MLRSFPHAAPFWLMVSSLLAPSSLMPAAHAEPPGVELTFETRETPGPATPGMPPGLPVVLQLDDNQVDGVFGLAGNQARQFLWFNRFDSPGPFVLEEIWVLFPPQTEVAVGDAVEILVYVDPDGDPTNGATLLLSLDEIVQANDGVAFSVYPLDAALELLGAGDVLIGVVGRAFQTGIDPPPTQPAALDTTASQGRSWFALWPTGQGEPGDPPPAPDLATAAQVTPLAGAISGNWMIRGFGSPRTVQPIPTASTLGLVLLAALLGIAALVVMRSR